MGRIKYGILLVMMLAAAGLWAQEPVEERLTLTGTVYDRYSNEPLPWCILRFMQDSMTRAMVVTDRDGQFVLEGIPAGTYSLHAMVHGRSLHQADLVLNQSANLSIAIDTVRLVNLRPVTIRQPKNMLGPSLITSTHDLRLWGFTAGYRDANASVAVPPDAHGNLDTGVSDGLMFDPHIPWQAQQAYLTGKLGTMLLTPPIWELVPDRVIPAVQKEKEGEKEDTATR